MDCFNLDGSCSHCNVVFETVACFYHACPSQEIPCSLIGEDIKRGNKEIRIDVQEERHTVIEILEIEWRRPDKTDKILQQIQENFDIFSLTCRLIFRRKSEEREVLSLCSIL